LLKVEIFSLAGQKTGFSLVQRFKEGQSNISLNYNLLPGTYILRLSTPDGQAKIKLVIL